MSSSLSNDNNNEASSSSPASKDLLNAGQRSIAQRLGLETSPTADNKSKDIMDTEQLKNQPKTKPAISHINAPNDLLARVSAFLPQMQQANQTLFQQITKTHSNMI
ncbi:hypothetical protein BDF19DRAFT_496166 [Syncephalis fuscata]|nr:hypothetical protein BDF19DRAFT_496166 [Syncephalis fuscata]